MRRSKLEIYEAILENLARKPLRVDSIAYRTNMNCIVVKQYLDFLANNGLVEEKFVGDKNFYAITERGKAVFRALSFQKRIDKITEYIKVINKALEALPNLKSKENDEEESKINNGEV
ncbi:MAG: winged helix-turn-helix domain-containing protein [Candidatus Bathyarchaeales archaeon]